MMPPEKKIPFILLGAGGHAKVLLSLAHSLNLTLLGICDPNLAKQGVQLWRGVPVLGNDEVLANYSPDEVYMINGVGPAIGRTTHQDIYEKMCRKGFSFPCLIHPQATVDPDAFIADGVQVMAGAVIQADSYIGENTLINTLSSIDHDCKIGSHVHVASGVSICGNVKIGGGALVAVGAVIAPGIIVGDNAIVGAGVALVRNLPPGQILLGVKPQNK